MENVKMKTRNDFVSNSSSSSFVLWGESFSLDELAQKLADAEPGLSSEDIGIDDIDDWCYKSFGSCSNYVRTRLERDSGNDLN